MDMCMRHCIMHYNDIVEFSKQSITSWENMIDRDEERMLQYDANIIMMYGNILNNITYEHFIVLNSTSCVAIFINDNYHNEKVDIINLGFFSGIGSDSVDFENGVSFDKLSDSNWKTWLHAKDKIASYSWIKSPNSPDPFNDGTELSIPDRVLSLQSVKDGIEYDDVILVRSKYLPYKFSHIVKILSLIPNKVNKGE